VRSYSELVELCDYPLPSLKSLVVRNEEVPGLWASNKEGRMMGRDLSVAFPNLETLVIDNDTTGDLLDGLFKACPGLRILELKCQDEEWHHLFTLPEVRRNKLQGQHNSSFIGAISRGSPHLEVADVDFGSGNDFGGLGYEPALFLSKVKTWGSKNPELLLKMLNCPGFQPQIIDFGWSRRSSRRDTQAALGRIGRLPSLEKLIIREPRPLNFARGLPHNVGRIALYLTSWSGLLNFAFITESAMSFPGHVDINASCITRVDDLPQAGGFLQLVFDRPDTSFNIGMGAALTCRKLASLAVQIRRLYDSGIRIVLRAAEILLERRRLDIDYVSLTAEDLGKDIQADFGKEDVIEVDELDHLEEDVEL
jgi:hypothetical protein